MAVCLLVVLVALGVVLLPARPASASSFVAIEDAYVDDGSPSTNFGTSTSLRFDAKPTLQRTFIRFSVQGVTEPITSARLRFICTNDGPDGGTVWTISGSWTETKITWRNQPTLAESVTQLGAITCDSKKGTAVEYDVTSAVTGDGVYDFALTTTSGDGIRFRSRELTKSAPRLVIDTAPTSAVDQTPTPTATLISPADGAFTNDNMPTFDWSDATDPSTPVTYDLLVDNNPDFSSPEISPTGLTVSTFTPATALADGTYSWKVRASDGVGNIGPFSTVFTFSIDTAPPETTISSSPDDPTNSEDEVLMFTPSDDAYVRGDRPNENFGSTTLQVDNSPQKSFLLKFSVSGVGGRQVVSAKLRLYCVDPSVAGGEFHRVADTWTEGSVTWNKAPAADVAVVASLGKVTVGTWYEVDVTPLVTGDGSVSLRVTSSSSNGADYYSKESPAGFAPQLVVTVSSSTTPDTSSTP